MENNQKEWKPGFITSIQPAGKKRLLVPIRNRYAFDIPAQWALEAPATCRYLSLEATASDSGHHVFYVEGGARGGCSFVAVLQNGVWAYSPGRWPQAIRRVFIAEPDAGYISQCVRRVANRAGAIESLTHVTNLGFDAEGYKGTWGSRWYTRFPFARSVLPPAWAGEGAKAWEIAEGLYLQFPDGSDRLVPYRELVSFYDPGAPDMRQGDLLIFETTAVTDNFAPAEEQLGNHKVVGLRTEDGRWVEAKITHPTHPPICLERAGWSAWTIKVAPGTNRPFQRD